MPRNGETTGRRYGRFPVPGHPGTPAAPWIPRAPVAARPALPLPAPAPPPHGRRGGPASDRAGAAPRSRAASSARRGITPGVRRWPAPRRGRPGRGRPRVRSGAGRPRPARTGGLRPRGCSDPSGRRAPRCRSRAGMGRNPDVAPPGHAEGGGGGGELPGCPSGRYSGRPHPGESMVGAAGFSRRPGAPAADPGRGSWDGRADDARSRVMQDPSVSVLIFRSLRRPCAAQNMLSALDFGGTLRYQSWLPMRDDSKAKPL